MARIINWVPFHWAQSARQQPYYPVDNWSVLPFISTLNAIKYHYWLSNLQSALGSRCLLRQGSASQIRGECSVRCNQQGGIASHPHFPPYLGWLLQNASMGCRSDTWDVLHLTGQCWKGKFIRVWPSLSFTHIRLFQCWTWVTMNSKESYFSPMVAEAKSRRFRDCWNGGQRRVTLVAQVSEPRLRLTLIQCDNTY